MTGPDHRPPSELGRAFADLADDMPPSSLSAASVIATADEQSARRHRWVLGSGIAAALVAVTTVIGVAMSTGSSTSSSAGSATSAASAGGGQGPSAGAGQSSPNAVQPPPAPTTRGSSSSVAGPGAGDGGGGQAEAEPSQDTGVCPARVTFSAEQRQLIDRALPGLGPSQEVCVSDAGTFGTSLSYSPTAGTVTVTVLPIAPSGCPSPPAVNATCSQLRGADDLTVISASGIDGSSALTVEGGRPDVSISVSVLFDESQSPPFPADRLASLVEALVNAAP